MKRTITLFASLVMYAQMSFAQVGTSATNFTVTDLSSNVHDLNTILASGRVVIIDCFATWCGTCWSFHNANFLNDINAIYGPTGTDQVRILGYEADATTTLADLQGTGGNTQGDWLTGETYPYVDENPLTLSGAKYWPLGFPTINVINPANGIIEGDLYDYWGGGLSAMTAFIDQFTSGASVIEMTLSNTSVFPNPSSGEMKVSFDSPTTEEVNIEVSNMVGQVVYTNSEAVVNGKNTLNLNLTDLNDGQYILKISNTNGFSTMNIQVKK